MTFQNNASCRSRAPRRLRGETLETRRVMAAAVDLTPDGTSTDAGQDRLGLQLFRLRRREERRSARSRTKRSRRRDATRRSRLCRRLANTPKQILVFVLKYTIKKKIIYFQLKER